ncbi:MAG TPA: hypothetical protein VMK31_09245 [Sphingomicrobium sp.]|nr:hypothetical protein [Sphingomicrobium sp.]
MKSGAFRWLGIVAAAAVAAVLGYKSLAIHLAARATSSENVALAAPVVSHSAEAASWIAMLHLAQGQAGAAEDMARLSLRTSPINPRAISVLAAVSHAQGDKMAAAQLLSLATSAGWREPLVQYWILSAALEAGQPELAAERADALLRQGVSEDQVVAHLRQLLATPQGRSAVAARLADHPMWRSRLLRQLSDLSPPQLRAHSQLLLAMRSAGVEPRPEEIASLVRRLMDTGDFQRARDVWTALVEDGRRTLVHDGSFEALGDRTARETAAFEWTMTDPLGIRAAVELPPRPLAGRAVRVSAEGGAAGVFLEQSVVLLPGHYSLELATLEAEGAELRTLRPRLQCVGGPSISPRFLGAAGAGWSRLHFRFEVPAGCPAQRLGLGLSGEGAGRVGLWLDEVSISAL